MEHLTPLERAPIAIDAGVDQLGGDRKTALIEELVDSGLVAEERVDQSIRRLLREKFQLGIFEHHRADVETARVTCGSPIYVEKGIAARRASLVLLSEDAGILDEGARVFVEGVQDVPRLTTTASMEDAEAIIVRLEALFEVGRGSVVAEYFHGGTLEFSDDTIARLRTYAAHAPLHVSVFLERPAILGPLVELGATVIGDFGASDAVVIDALTVNAPMRGVLPFDIPSSMGTVENSREDAPFDTDAPLFRAGSGITREAIQTTMAGRA